MTNSSNGSERRIAPPPPDDPAWAEFFNRLRSCKGAFPQDLNLTTEGTVGNPHPRRRRVPSLGKHHRGDLP